MKIITRFAPSPTGPLHLGHAYSALLAKDIMSTMQGDFLLRIEDIDQSRARDHWETQIYDDLAWLGLCWASPVMRQSNQMGRYQKTLQKLWEAGFLYPCTCRRRDIEAAASAPQEGAPSYGPDGLVYPQTCKTTKSLDQSTESRGEIPNDAAIRLDMQRACTFYDQSTQPDSGSSGEQIWTAFFNETGCGPNGETGRVEFTIHEVLNSIGDIVLSRRGMGTSYHLSVVLDDAAQGITHVVRGQDLFEATKIHVILQRLLGLPTPIYHHHKLVRDETGKRLAKRDDARAIAKYRAEGATPQDIRKLVGLD